MTTHADTSGRRHELDAIRVLAFGLLIFYHIGMMYVAASDQGWHWHIKSSYTSEWLQNLMLFSSQWRMSLLFFISGAVLSFVLPNIQGWRFLLRRIKQLGAPLLLGVLVLVPPQLYFQMAFESDLATTDYISWWQAYLQPTHEWFANQRIVGDMHYTWNHLWYLPYLLVYTLLLLILQRGYRQLHYYSGAVGPTSTRSWHAGHFLLLILIPVVVFTAFGVVFRGYEGFQGSLFDDWHRHANYFSVFALGYLLVQWHSAWSAIERYRRLSLIMAAGCFAAVLANYHGHALFGSHSIVADLASLSIWKLNRWIWMLALLGYAIHYLKRPSTPIKYLNQGVFCYYILHQSVIIAVGYPLSQLGLGPVLEPLMVVTATLLICACGYELLRRVSPLKLWFGIADSDRAKPLVSLRRGGFPAH
ncbi:acyltransferase family protein [Pseudomaricurvus alkylphenolicus]|uniref:acyltransferase family protein n=1 Tax=Pseudomaricurvus alkylphenolicus TaxID=1306991 RepID=UPI00141D86D8|nr:acyltransferase family protein [Pseudomaricurvus alkylphenolicus]NIB38422.1 acyltransferase family protein [Pseudomaricurvus alkylphenolicus]